MTAEILEQVPRKRADQNKYTAGTVLVVGGSRGLTGAPCLAAEAAFRADAGYVAVAVPDSTLPVFEQRLLEAVKLRAPRTAAGSRRARSSRSPSSRRRRARSRSGRASGEARGRRRSSRGCWRSSMCRSSSTPTALFELEPFERKAPTVLTPHEGELGRLLGEESSWVAAHRLEAARRAAERFGCVCVLKGADTLVASPGEGVWVCSLGTPALATAGSGDVLTGIVAAFLAKGMESRLAAAAAATAHQLASKEIPQAGAVASDLIGALPLVLSR